MHFVFRNTKTIENEFYTIRIFKKNNFYRIKAKGGDISSRKEKGHSLGHILFLHIDT